MLNQKSIVMGRPEKAVWDTGVAERGGRHTHTHPESDLRPSPCPSLKLAWLNLLRIPLRARQGLAGARPSHLGPKSPCSAWKLIPGSLSGARGVRIETVPGAGRG